MTNEKPYSYRAFSNITAGLIAEAESLQDLAISLKGIAHEGSFIVKTCDMILVDSAAPISYDDEDSVIHEESYEDISDFAATLVGR